jgi:hypothetical protein
LTFLWEVGAHAGCVCSDGIFFLWLLWDVVMTVLGVSCYWGISSMGFFKYRYALLSNNRPVR